MTEIKQSAIQSEYTPSETCQVVGCTEQNNHPSHAMMEGRIVSLGLCDKHHQMAFEDVIQNVSFSFSVEGTQTSRFETTEENQANAPQDDG